MASFSHNVSMKSLEFYENYITLFCLEKSNFLTNNVLYLFGNALICASTMLKCSCCRIHRYVAAQKKSKRILLLSLFHPPSIRRYTLPIYQIGSGFFAHFSFFKVVL